MTFLVLSCTGKVNSKQKLKEDMSIGTDTITFGAGCFWCVEAVFQQVKGVTKVTSGYMGGKLKNPTYREVCSGLTGHAEVCQLVFDSKVVSVDKLLEIFWQTHDPTTLNRQGHDIGTQYRSAVFFHNEEQKAKATSWKKQLNDKKVFPNPIVTEITQASTFYPAEDYHQNYFQENGEEPYCQVVIKPKMDKFLKEFKSVLK
ncbi:peptide-methionine (S)-S-oxide reductase [Sandaracinomonas limnophila]|uniref:Peptide methionine sulfoxide reductase MsrA n=2 Tax=Sandaracinomonas limnophila TaxID=1862386 RepID=A0A437PUT4_9BACT|nr:peptide-methionine (S)-S-oxide reductase [Sandaracinomonas limnophila]